MTEEQKLATPLERIVKGKQDIAACLRESAANLSGFGGKCQTKESAEWLDHRVAYLRRLADDVEALAEMDRLLDELEGIAATLHEQMREVER